MENTSQNSLATRVAITLATLGLAALAGQPLAAQPAATQQPAPAHAVPVFYPVVINGNGNLASLFFAGGERVKRGQLLAKIERPNGSMFFVSAPVTGRITEVKLSVSKPIVGRTVLAMIEVVPTVKP